MKHPALIDLSRPLPVALMRVAISGAVALSSSVASAVPVASASAGPLQFEIVDLRPDDGVAAGFRLDRQAHAPWGHLVSWSGSHVVVDHYFPWSRVVDSESAFLADKSVSLNDVNGSGTASIADDTLFSSSSTRAFGATSALAEVYVGYYVGEPPPPGYYGLEIAPYTTLTLSFETQLRIADDGMTAGENEFAEAMVTFDVSAPDGLSSDSQLQVVQRILQSRSWGRAEERERTEILSLSLTNDSDELMHGVVSLQTSALSVIGPIPEPSTAALGLVGGLTLLVLRRRSVFGGPGSGMTGRPGRTGVDDA